MQASKLFLAASFCLIPTLAFAQARPNRTAEEAVNDPQVRARAHLLPGDTLLFNGWGVTPAGDHAKISDMPLKMILSKDGKTLITVSGGYSNEGLTLLDISTKKVTQFLPIVSAFNGLALTPAGDHILVTGGDKGVVHDFSFADGKATLARTVKPEPKAADTFLAGMSIQNDTGRVFVCNEGNSEIWALNPQSLEVENKIPVGEHPYACTLGADQRHLYVSDWGSRSVTVVDTKTNKRVRDIPVGIRPNDLTLSKDGRLFVACSGDNTVHVIQTRALEAAPGVADSTRLLPDSTREIISTSLYPQSPEGSTPDAVAVTPDGQTLFVANADNNSVMVLDISGRTLDGPQRGQSVSMVEGFVPVGWYPCSLAVSSDGQTLMVGNGKGLRSVSNVSANATTRPNGSTPYRHIASTMDGDVSFIAKPDAQQIVSYTQQVRKNSPYTPESLRKSNAPNDSIIPSVVNAANNCPIKHVLYIIKENRTYDQVFGDMKNAKGEAVGMGDSAITMYGEQVTPNQHELARQYVLLDNLYCNGEVSVDGHSWCDAAIATDWKQRSWIQSYSKHGVVPGNAEMDVPTAGYLWDLCQRHGVTYRNYGEGAAKVPNSSRGKWVNGWGIRDMDRVKFWIDDLKAAEKGEQELPQFTIMSLGENHTQGTTPGAHTPRACVASNDLAVARVVEAASNSKFWKEMAIFIIEDDAQNGPDHIDAHRTAGLVLSPWCKRGQVDSTLYTTASMVRTIELILGLPPLTQYDAGATPMFNCFAKESQVVAYNAKTPTIDMMAKNTARAPRAAESARMNFKDYDRAPEDALNQILWLDAKGPDVPYPTPIHRAMFTTPTSEEPKK